MADESTGDPTSKLHQMVEQSIQWQEWGESAFKIARDLDRPIFLFVEKISSNRSRRIVTPLLQDGAVVEFLNQRMVPILVDWDERPDVGEVYRYYLNAAVGRSDPPISVVLNPLLVPIWEEDVFLSRKMPVGSDFRTFLESIEQAWRNNREEIDANAHQVAANLVQSLNTPKLGVALPDLVETAEDVFDRAYTYFFENYDEQNGGFGGAPKFIPIGPLSFLIRCAIIQSNDFHLRQEAMGFLKKTLSSIARSGTYDVVGGGVFRYAQDDEWRLPVFEKCLLDQARAAGSFLEAAGVSGDARFAAVARHILEFSTRELEVDGGVFKLGQFSPSVYPKLNDEYYLWSRADLHFHLQGDFGWFSALFDIHPAGNISAKLDPEGNFRGLNVLHQAKPLADVANCFGTTAESLAQRLECCLVSLDGQRSSRPKRRIDGKIVVPANAAMITALARASVMTDFFPSSEARRFLASALRAADFIWTHAWDSETCRLRHCFSRNQWVETDVAEDYVAMTEACLALFEATFDVRWLQRALDLQETLDRWFGDLERGGYFDSAEDTEHLFLRLKMFSEGHLGSTNSLAATNMFRLFGLLGDDSFRRKGFSILQASRDRWSDSPWRMPHLLQSLEWAISSPCRVWIVGELETTETQNLLRAARNPRAARRSVIHVGSARAASWWKARFPNESPDYLSVPAAFVVRNKERSATLSTPEELCAELDDEWCAP